MRPGLTIAGWLAISTLFSMPGRAARPQDPQEQQKPVEAQKKGTVSESKESEQRDAAKDNEPETSTALKGNWKNLGERVLIDQKQIWTCPARLPWPEPF